MARGNPYTNRNSSYVPEKGRAYFDTIDALATDNCTAAMELDKG